MIAPDERSDIRERTKRNPDFAFADPGYACSSRSRRRALVRPSNAL